MFRFSADGDDVAINIDFEIIFFSEKKNEL